jgi:hypothetical protein
VTAPTRVGDILRVGDQDIEAGKLYVLRSEIQRYRDEPEEILHVISAFAGGEIRGYRRLRGEASWKLRHPANPVSWTELDAAVAELLAEEVTP